MDDDDAAKYYIDLTPIPETKHNGISKANYSSSDLRRTSTSSLASDSSRDSSTSDIRNHYKMNKGTTSSLMAPTRSSQMKKRASLEPEKITSGSKSGKPDTAATRRFSSTDSKSNITRVQSPNAIEASIGRPSTPSSRQRHLSSGSSKSESSAYRVTKPSSVAIKRNSSLESRTLSPASCKSPPNLGTSAFEFASTDIVQTNSDTGSQPSRLVEQLMNKSSSNKSRRKSSESKPKINKKAIIKDVDKTLGSLSDTLRKLSLLESEKSYSLNIPERPDYSVVKHRKRADLIEGSSKLDTNEFLYEDIAESAESEVADDSVHGLTDSLQQLSGLSQSIDSISSALKRRTSSLDLETILANYRSKSLTKSEDQVKSEKEWLEAERVWLVHKGGFASATLLKTNGTPLPEGKVLIKLNHDGEILEVDEDDIEKANPPQFDKTEDLSTMRYLNESSMLHTLRQRFGSNLIHTYQGPSISVMNPMHSLAIYSEKVIQMLKGCKQEDMPPHIFSAAQIAYREMLNTRSDQSLVFLGRSGSGKSTNVRHVLHYLTVAAGSINNILTVDKLTAIMNLLESFGNSRTILNTNASRFGQITTLDYDHAGQIASASVQVVMFEKARVVRRPEGEPTFHIFYQMLAGVNSQTRNELHLNVLNEPNLFMTPLQRPEDRQRAVQSWSKIQNSMEIVGISEAESKAIFSVLAAIYHLGIAGASKGTNNKAQFSKPTAAQKAANLLGISVEELSRLIFSSGSSTLSRSTSLRVPSASSLDKHGGSDTSSPALESLEGFVIGLYADVFNAIVSLINRSLSSTYRNLASIAVVDLPGFQNPTSCGRQNGANFEDLCFNYVQERLQLLYHEKTVTQQQDRLAQENIDCDFEFVNTSPAAMVSLIDKTVQASVGRTSAVDLKDLDKKGLLWLLDEEAIFPGSSDDSFLERIFTHHLDSPIRRDSLMRKGSVGKTFILNHFQGTNPVQYNASGWLKMCRDNPISKITTAVLQDSKRSNISELFNNVKAPVAGVVSGSVVGMEGSTSLRRVGSMRRTFMSGAAGLKKRSLCLHVKFQADSVVEQLRKSKCHYIFCILPLHNAGLCELKTPQGKSPQDDILVNVPLVRSQVRGFEVLESLRIFKQCFPDHILLDEFRRKFAVLVPPNSRPSESLDDKQAVGQLLDNLDIDKLNYRIGLSRVFFRSGALSQLENSRDEKITGTVVAFQSYCRGYLGRKKLEKLQIQHLAVSCIQRNVRKFVLIRDWEWWRLYLKCKPLLNVQRTEDELRDKEIELEQMKLKLDKIEKERHDYRQHCDKLEIRLSELTADLTEENNTATHAAEMLEAETADRMKLEKELKDTQSKLNVVKRQSEKLEMEVMQSRLWQAQAIDGEIDEDEEGADSVYRERYDKLMRELDFTKRKLKQEYNEEIEQERQAKKNLERKLIEAVAEADEQRQLLQASKKRHQKLQSEMQDVKRHSEEQTARNNDLERKQRKFDTELNNSKLEAQEERQMREKLQREKDLLTSEKYAVEQEIQGLKSDVSIQKEKHERLEREMGDMTITGTSDKELLGLKRAKHDLELKVKELEEELDDLTGDFQQLEQSKLQLQMNTERLKQQHARELDEKDEELEESRYSSQKKLKQLKAQLEEEYEDRQALLKQKKDLEAQLLSIQSAIPQRDKDAERRISKDLKRTKALLKDAEIMIQNLQKTAEHNKALIKELRNQNDDAEFTASAAQKAKKTMEAEISDLHQQIEELSRVKQEAETRGMAVAREKTEVQNELEENEEDFAETMKKFKAVVQQQSTDQITLQDQLRQIEELTLEKEEYKRQVADLTSKLKLVEDTHVEKHSVMRLESKIRDLENKLDYEQTNKHRIEIQISRLKEQSEKLSEERDLLNSSKRQVEELMRKQQREMRELRDELAEVQKKELEASQKRKELEQRLLEMETDYEQNQSDLKLAFKRISDLKAALEEDMDSDLDLLSESDEDDDYSTGSDDFDSFLSSHQLRKSDIALSRSVSSSYYSGSPHSPSSPRSRAHSSASNSAINSNIDITSPIATNININTEASYA